jgi:hypothetical protein
MMLLRTLIDNYWKKIKGKLEIDLKPMRLLGNSKSDRLYGIRFSTTSP